MSEISIEELTEHINQFTLSAKKTLIKDVGFAYYSQDEKVYYKIELPEYINKSKVVCKLDAELVALNRDIAYVQLDIVMNNDEDSIARYTDLYDKRAQVLEELDTFQQESQEQRLLKRYRNEQKSLEIELEDTMKDIRETNKERKAHHTYSSTDEQTMSVDNYVKWYDAWKKTDHYDEWTSQIQNLHSLLSTKESIHKQLDVQEAKIDNIQKRTWIIKKQPLMSNISSQKFAGYNKDMTYVTPKTISIKKKESKKESKRESKKKSSKSFKMSSSRSSNSDRQSVKMNLKLGKSIKLDNPTKRRKSIKLSRPVSITL